ncbi:MAG TPA: hypothetical protein DHU62_04270 [Firmicutes bacterium]|jgi:hypothetical protein|nr:hypothetical protein [Bacillota bacterium]
MKSKRSERQKANLKIASILFENGMDFSVIEKITDVTPLELLGSKIDIQNRSNDKSEKNRKK